MQSITSLINKASTGPSHIKGTNQSVVPMSVIEQTYATSSEDDDPVEISNVADSSVVREYGENLESTDASDFPPDMMPYIHALKGDSLRIFQDFCEGKFELMPPKFMTVAKRKARECLNPIRIYRRVYIKEGWSLERVRNAWRGLQGIFSCYCNNKLPALLCSPKFAQASTEENSSEKRAKWLDSFKARHGITYGAYRSLRKKGLIPAVDKDNLNEDFSKYALA